MFIIGAVPTYSCYTEGQLSFGITNLACNGSEEHILNCTHSNPVLYNCQSRNDAGLVCQGIYAADLSWSSGGVCLLIEPVMIGKQKGQGPNTDWSLLPLPNMQHLIFSVFFTIMVPVAFP